MSEFTRLLRYAIPGGVFELLLAVGLFLTNGDEILQLKGIGMSGQVWITLSIAAAFPLGFLISVIANEIAWFWHWICTHRRLWGRISTTCILDIARREYPHRRLLQKVEGSEAEQSFVEIILRSYNEGEAYRAANDRLHSMADLLNGIMNASVAVVLAVLLCAALLLCTAFGIREADVDVAHTKIFFGVTLVLLLCLWMAERRLARIAEAFAIGMIRARWR